MKTKFFVTLTLVLGIAFISNAQTIRKSERHERHRIEQGVRSGELTPLETRRLAAEQRDIHRDIWIAKHNDGVIGPRERRHIRRDERRASRDIYRAKHNGRKRF